MKERLKSKIKIDDSQDSQPTQEEEKKEQPQQQFDTKGGLNNTKTLGEMNEEEKIEFMKQNTQKLKNLEEDKIKAAVERMKNNRAQMMAMYKAQGIPMDDAGFDALIAQMEQPDYLKNLTAMLEQNPDMMKQAMAQKQQME